MPNPLTLELLASIACETMGLRRLVLTPEMTASEVPGWDSLAHTLIVFEIERRLQIELSAEESTQAQTMGDLVDLVNSRR